MPHVTSPDNPRLKEAMRLIASSRERRKSGRCVLEGEHLVAAFAARHGAPELVIVAAGTTSGALPPGIAAGMKPSDVLVVSEKTWAELTQLPATTGVLAVVSAPQPVFKRSS
jgi:tRNA G18 (ribose-2'-O)-methylase SpoU